MARALPEIGHRKGCTCCLSNAIRMVLARGRLLEHRQSGGLETVQQKPRRVAKCAEQFGCGSEKRSGMVPGDARCGACAAVAPRAVRTALRGSGAQAS